MSRADALALGKIFESLFAHAHDVVDARECLYRLLRDDDRLPLVTLHRYMCAKRGCQIATVFQAGNRILCAVRDFKLSPGLNTRASDPAARTEHTLDGERHWPGHVYDVRELSDFGTPEYPAGMTMACRHFRGAVRAADVLAVVNGVEPGHPGPPTRLGG